MCRWRVGGLAHYFWGLGGGGARKGVVFMGGGVDGWHERRSVVMLGLHRPSDLHLIHVCRLV